MSEAGGQESGQRAPGPVLGTAAGLHARGALDGRGPLRPPPSLQHGLWPLRKGSEYTQLSCCSRWRALGEGHSQRRPDTAREARPGGHFLDSQLLPSVLRRPRPQRRWMKVSLSPRPLEGGSDKSFKSSFYGGGNRCWKWAPHARKPQQLGGKQPICHWQTIPLAHSCLTRPRLAGLSAPVSFCLCSRNPQGFPPRPHRRPS